MYKQDKTFIIIDFSLDLFIYSIHEEYKQDKIFIIIPNMYIIMYGFFFHLLLVFQ